MGHNVSKGKIAYLLNSFPKLSETFILNEIWELKSKSNDVFLVAMSRSQEEIVHAKAKAISPGVIYFGELGRKRKFENVLIAGIFHPLRFIRTVTFIWKRFENRRIWKLKQTLYLGGELIRNGVKHVHAHFAMEAAEMAMLSGILTGIPYSMHPHALDIYVRPRMLKEKMAFAKFVSTECEFNKKFLLQYYLGYPEKRIVVIRLGIDLKAFAPREFRLSEGIARDGLEILAVARLVEKKGIIYLLKAVKKVVDKNIDVKVRIVGDGPEYERLERFIQENRMGDRIELKGPRPSEYVKNLFDDSDVFVLPCIVANNGDQDATPTAILEAMAMKIPVISTTVAGIPEIIPTTAGIVVAPNDTDALADALIKINDMQRTERYAMGDVGHKFIYENCNIEKETAKLLSLIKM